MPAEPNTSTEHKNAPAKRAPNRVRTWIFRIVSVTLIPLLFLAGIELCFRFIHPGYPTSFVIPSEATPNRLIDNYKFSWRFFPKALARSSQPLSIEKVKPAEVKRIIVFGGSAAMGDPEPAYGMPRVLQIMLERKFPDQAFEVINAAVTAVNSHVVLPIVNDCRQLDADAWVVYMGNNEVHGPFGNGTVFGGRETPLSLIRWSLAFQRTSSGQYFQSGSQPTEAPKAWGGLKMFLEQSVRADDPTLERVYHNFESNLRAIATTAKRNRTPLIVSTVVTNLIDHAPFISKHKETLSDAELERWTNAFQAGCEFQHASQTAEAIKAFSQASDIDDSFAELQYRLGQCYALENNYDRARKHFQNARDFDTLRFRADSRINQIIRDVSNSQHVGFVDAENEFQQQSEHQLTGRNFLYEHVHFNFSGNYLLAKLIANQVADQLGLDVDAAPHWPNEQECAYALGLTPFHRSQVLKELQTRLRVPPFSNQFQHASRMQKLDEEIRQHSKSSNSLVNRSSATGDPQFNELIATKPDDWVLRKQYAMMLSPSLAIKQWRKVTQLLPHFSEGHFHLGSNLNRTDDKQEAEKALRKAISIRPNFPTAYNSLAVCLAHQDRFEESYQCFEKAVQLRPNYAEAYYKWGMVLATQKQADQAIKKYETAIEVDPNYTVAVEHLRKHYVTSKQFEKAAVYSEKLVDIMPNSPEARMNHFLLLMKLERKQEALKHLEHANKLAPSHPLIRKYLRALKL